MDTLPYEDRLNLTRWSIGVEDGVVVQRAPDAKRASVFCNQSINQYSFNDRHVKMQANTCMTYN